MIRYVLEDRVTQLPGTERHGHLVATVQGKSADTFVYGDSHVNPRIVFAPIIESPKVFDYQIRQTKWGVNVDLLSENDPDVDALRATILQRLEQSGLPQAQVSIRIVDALMRDPHTGKMSRLIPLSKEDQYPSTILG